MSVTIWLVQGRITLQHTGDASYKDTKHEFSERKVQLTRIIDDMSLGKDIFLNDSTGGNGAIRRLATNNEKAQILIAAKEDYELAHKTLLNL